MVLFCGIWTILLFFLFFFWLTCRAKAALKVKMDARFEEMKIQRLQEALDRKIQEAASDLELLKATKLQVLIVVRCGYLLICIFCFLYVLHSWPLHPKILT